MNRNFPILLAVSCLVLTGSTAFAQTARARIADTPVRAEANLASATVATLNEGDPVDVVDVQGAWYRVLVPGTESTPQVGYVLARLIEVTNGDAPAQSAAAPPTSLARPTGSVPQGPQIPPTLAHLEQQRAKAEREQALRADVDALQAELEALQNNQSTGQNRSTQIPHPAVPRSQTRKGLWFNGGLGFGAASCAGCDFSLNGSSGGLSLGTTISDRLLVGVGTTGYRKSTLGIGLNIGTVDARLRFYPVRTSGFFLTGGMGLGSISIADETALGIGAVLGLGWDIRVGSNVSLTPFWNGIGVAGSNANARVGQLGLGLTIH